jgi:hypothetical protein
MEVLEDELKTYDGGTNRHFADILETLILIYVISSEIQKEIEA